MIQDRAKGVVACRQIVELVTAQGVLWCGYGIAVAGGNFPISGQLYVGYALAVFVGMMVYNIWSNEGHAPSTRSGWLQIHWQASRLVAIVAISLLFLSGALRDMQVSRGFLLVISACLYPSILVANRWFVRPVLTSCYASQQDLTLVLGKKSGSREWKAWLKGQRELGLEVIYADQMFAQAELDPSVQGLPTLDTLAQAVERESIAQIILLEFPEDHNYLRGLVATCNQRGIRMLINHDFHQQIGHSVCFFNHDGVHLISLRKEPLENPVNRILKRSFDVVFSCCALLLTMPFLIPVVWFLQQRQSPGPIFFFQRRAGLKNGRFTMVKFRTMHTEHGCEALQVKDGDCRLFPAGRVLRKFSLDEVPQFWNVLRGEMSVIGPRPHMIEHNENFEKVLAHYNVRTLVRPGVTGLAQIRGLRGETPGYEAIETRVASDIFYIENWSFALDLLIVAKTVLQVVHPPCSAK